MRGLLVIEPLYHQIIAGNKTQTRRSGGLAEVNINPDNWDRCQRGYNADNNWVRFYAKDAEYRTQCRPRYKIGEVLYLKEPIREVNGVGDVNYTQYAFSTNAVERRMAKWQNKLFMPASAARAFIRITGIRCERLMDISDHDCIAEGIEIIDYADAPVYKDGSKVLGPEKWPLYKIYHKMTPQVTCISEPKSSFISLYKFANKVKEVPNLWVFCYNFEYLPNYNPNK